MLLVSDVGNTQTVVGLLEGEDVYAQWRLSTVAERTRDEFMLLLGGLLDTVDQRPTGAALSSVVPASTHALAEVMESLTDGPVVVVGPGIKTGMPINIDNPKEVGADRVVNAVAAAFRYGTPSIVVDFGTATTVDLVGVDGGYEGGAISPGVEVSADALVASTAALRRVEVVAPRSPVGKSTVEAIQSGLVHGYAGLVDGLVKAMAATLNGAEPHTVATGGLASIIVPHCRSVENIDSDLTLLGLRLLYERNVEA